MNVGTNLWTVYGWQLTSPISTETLRRLGEVGSRCVELVMDEHHNSADALIQRRLELMSALERADMTVPSIGSVLFHQYNFASKDDSIRNRAFMTAQDGCRVAAAFGAGVLLVIAGQQEPGVEYEQTYQTAVESLQRTASYAAAEGITLGVENVPGNFLSSPGEYARFIRDVDRPNVRAYLDFGNGAAIGPSFPENWITAVSGLIALVHAKDYDSKMGAFVCCGQGDLDWEAVRGALDIVRYDGCLIVETPPHGGAGTIDPSAGLEAAQMSIAGLKRLVLP